MARCCNGAECGCVLTQGENISVTGLGTLDNPYVIALPGGPPGAWVSTDGSYGLPEPLGVGGEWVIVGGVLDDIRYDGNSL